MWHNAMSILTSLPRSFISEKDPQFFFCPHHRFVIISSSLFISSPPLFIVFNTSSFLRRPLSGTLSPCRSSKPSQYLLSSSPTHRPKQPASPTRHRPQATLAVFLASTAVQTRTTSKISSMQHRSPSPAVPQHVPRTAGPQFPDAYPFSFDKARGASANFMAVTRLRLDLPRIPVRVTLFGTCRVSIARLYRVPVHPYCRRPLAYELRLRVRVRCRRRAAAR